MRKWIILGILLITIGGAVFYPFVIRKAPSIEASKEAAAAEGLLNKTIQEDYRDNFVPAVASKPEPTPTPEMETVSPAQMIGEVVARKKEAPMRIYTSSVQPTPTPEEEYQGDYAPTDRLVRCKLVNTVDSSNIVTPIIGMVTDDLVWDGKIIIPRCSEVHGVAQVDKSRERIAAEGAWTFILHDQDNPGRGRELVVKGLGLDREDDPEFKRMLVGPVVVDPSVKTWGITDASSGLRGVVIRSNNAAALQLFVATFISGIAQSVQGTVTNIFGQTVPSPNASGAGGVPGYIINPPAQGAEAVLDRYAQMVMDSIERDGFFIRVPAGKLFYVYVTEDILTGKATVGGARRLRDVQSDFLEDRSLQEKVTEPRTERDAKARNPNIGVQIDPRLTHSLDEASQALEKRSEQLQQRTDQLSQPSPTP